jgi:hypothetical protein
MREFSRGLRSSLHKVPKSCYVGPPGLPACRMAF